MRGELSLGEPLIKGPAPSGWLTVAAVRGVSSFWGGHALLGVVNVEVSDSEIDELYWCAYSVALRLLGDGEEAKECAQEAAARALARWSRVAPFARPWVVRVSSNLAIGVLRKRGKVSLGLPELTAPGLDALDGLPARLDLRAGLLGLPWRQRQVVVMRYIGDLSEEETAKALSVSVASVKTHARRGLGRLRRILANEAQP